MTSKSECPREADLKRLMMHEMPDAEADRVARHLAECSRCAETVRLLNVDDTLADALHQPQPEVLDESDSVVVDGLIEQLRFLAHVRTLGSELSGSRSPRDTESEMRSVGVGPATPPGGSDARGEISPEAAAPPETYDFLEPAQGPDELGRLGPYRVLRVLGFGGMGVVFEAEDQQLARRVALKVMKPALAASDSARRRFLREARATAAIEHDHIVPIYHVGESRGMPFLAEQLLKGETLEDRLQRIEAQRRSETERRMETKRGSPGVSSLMPLAEVLRIGREIAEGLAAAHQRGLIHRDIKPANVWMQERVQGSGFRVQQLAEERVQGSGFRVQQLAEERVQGSGFRVQQLAEERVQGSGFRVQELPGGESSEHGVQGSGLGARRRVQGSGRKPHQTPEPPPLPPSEPRTLNTEPSAEPRTPNTEPSAEPRTPNPEPSVPPRVKLLDFGLVRAADDESGLTQTGSVAGTPAYMAPEQARGEPVDHRADLFSLGCVLYRLCTGELPFKGSNPTAIVLAVAQQRPKPVRTLRPDLPAAIDTLVMKLLEKAPSRRVQSAQHLIAMIAGIERELQQSTGDLTAGSRRGVTARFGRRWLVTAAAICLALLFGITWYAGQLKLRVKTPHGTVVLEIDQPEAYGASVTVDGEHKLTIGLDGEVKPLEISVDAGTHQLRVAKDGFALFTRDFSLRSGDREPIRVWLEPLGREAVPEKTDRSGRRIAESDQSTAVPSSAPSAAADVLAGIVPRPASVPGIRRWQVETVLPRGEILSVAWSPDGKRLACGTAVGHIRIYDATSLELEHMLVGHSGPVHCVAWSSDQSWLASGSEDGTVRLWNDLGVPIRVLGRHFGRVQTLAIAPDGKRLASAGWDATIRIWQTDGEPGPELMGHDVLVMALAWSPDGTQLASASWDGTARLWTGDGRPGPVLKSTEQTGMLSVAWSPNGQRLATGGSDGAIRLWSADGIAGQILRNHRSHVFALVWGPNDLLASGGEDGSLRLWRTDGTLDSIRQPELGRIHALAWDPDGNRLACGGAAHAIRIYDGHGQPLSAVKGTTSPVRAVAWSVDNRIASGGDDPAIRLWSADGSRGAVLRGHKLPVYSLAWSRDATRLASGSWDWSARIWDPTNLAAEVLQGNNPVAWNPSGDELAYGRGNDIVVRRPNGQERVLQGHLSSVLCLAWNADGTIASGDLGGTIRVWSPQGAEDRVLQGPTFTSALGWNRPHRLLASGCGPDGVVRIWEPYHALEPRQLLRGALSSVTAVQWSGQRLASASTDGSVRLWSPNGGAASVLPTHASQVHDLAWSPDGEHFVTAQTDGTIRRWSAPTREQQWVALPFDDDSVTFDQSGRFLGDGTPSASVTDRLMWLVEDSVGVVHRMSWAEFEARTHPAFLKSLVERDATYRPPLTSAMEVAERYRRWSGIAGNVGELQLAVERASAGIVLLDRVMAGLSDGVEDASYLLHGLFWYRAMAHERLGDKDASLRDWDEAARHEPEPRRTARIARTFTLRRMDGVERAIAEARELAALPELVDHDLYELARAFGECLNQLSQNSGPEQDATVTQLQLEAISCLERAERLGYFKDPAPRSELQVDSAFDALRNRPEFRALVSSVSR